MKKLFILFSITVLFTGLALADETALINPTPMPELGKASPLANSKFFVVESVIHGGTADVVLPLDTPKGAIAMVLGQASISAVTSDNRELSCQTFSEGEMERMNIPSLNSKIDLDSLRAGKSVLHLNGLVGDQTVKMVVSQPQSPVALEVMVRPLAPRCGEPVTVLARVMDNGVPNSVTIKGSLPNAPAFYLNDKGENGDAVANDGLYTATITAPKVDGFKGMNILFRAEGSRENGDQFRRDVVNSMMVTDPASSLEAADIHVAGRSLQIPLKAANGRFRVEAIFGHNGTAFTYARKDVTLNGNNAVVSLEMPELATSANHAIIRLLNIDTLGKEDEVEIALTPTTNAPDFDSLRFAPPVMPESKAKAAQKHIDE